ncbi:38bb1569-5f64-43a4-9e03-073c7ad673a2 [Sclerotinia trifoliorum]|uniref:38bb1569-5f64-43a4-9e03-073c7ad673a2 n=1 Tax=Sclerotinia trifoliorum TaxID=28548 RepID=A0A8H2VMS5_9HELO|nr:38bb1569-5f64-43a4-9e03-073c7ad673a2 [Sclerotinia trifoliorum]
MVKLSQVIESNQSIRTLPPGLVSVFVGASHEFERAIVRSFAKYGNAKYENAPKIYIIDSFVHENKLISSFVDELEKVNPAGSYKTFNVRIGILSEVDRVCDDIRKVEGCVDLLIMSCGFMRSPRGKDRSAYEESHLSDEDARGGVPFDIALQFYIRQRFITNLLPLLSKSRCPRVISLLLPGNDSPTYFETLDTSKKYLDTGSINHATSLLFSEYAKTHPEVTFINVFPGIINYDTWDRMGNPVQGVSWYPATVLKWTMPPLFKYFMCIPTEEVAERIVFLATSVRYPPGKEKRDEGKVAGLAECPPAWKLFVVRSMIMKDGRGNGVYRINEEGEACEESEVLTRYLEQEEGKWLLEHTEEVFGKMLNAERASNDAN